MIESPELKANQATSALKEHAITVLLVDDQAMIGEAVRRMLAEEQDIRFHYCGDPTQAIQTAMEILPTVILQDLVMPEVDGLTLVKFFRANPATRDIPMIVLSTKEEPTTKAEAFALGANDYLVKLPDKIELIARIRYHSKGYINLLQRNEAYRALVESQQRLAAELAEAAAYVTSLLPQPLTGEITVNWTFIPSTELGGDAFGYHWLDDQHFAMYLLDVCGHGVGAALLSISAMNVLRSQTLPNTDFHQPSQVLSALNDTFQMDHHNGMYFTIWYGVFNKENRRIVYASGGHPPAVLLSMGSAASPEPSILQAKGLVIGGMPGVPYRSQECEVKPASKLYFFSDGVYEVTKPDGSMLEFKQFVDFLAQPAQADVSDLDRVERSVRALNRTAAFDDDYSMVEVVFD